MNFKPIGIPTRWDHTIITIVPDNGGAFVTFDCNHKVWFAVPVKIGQKYHCSVCFDEWFKKNVKTIKEKKGNASRNK